MEGEKFGRKKNREEIQLKMKKENLIPIFAYEDLFFPVFLQFLVELTHYEETIFKILDALCQLWSGSTILAFFRSENREEIRKFP